jgi:hypothetical protein
MGTTTKKGYVPELHLPLCKRDTYPHPRAQLVLCRELAKACRFHALGPPRKQTDDPSLRPGICHDKCCRQAELLFQSEWTASWMKKSQEMIKIWLPVSLMEHSFWKMKWRRRWQPFSSSQERDTTTTFSCLLVPYLGKNHQKSKQDPKPNSTNTTVATSSKREPSNKTTGDKREAEKQGRCDRSTAIARRSEKTGLGRPKVIFGETKLAALTCKRYSFGRKFLQMSTRFAFVPRSLPEPVFRFLLLVHKKGSPSLCLCVITHRFT